MNLNATILAQMIVFACVVGATMKWFWPMIMEPITKRTQEIADGLAAAERARQDRAEAEVRAEQVLKAARERALAMEQQAQVRANQIVEAAKQGAQSEAARILEMAQSQLALEAQKAREELRGKVAALAISGAEKIIEREIDPRAHAQLLDKLALGL